MRGNYLKIKEMGSSSNSFKKDDVFEEFKLVRNILLNNKKLTNKRALLNFYYIFKSKISYVTYLDLILSDNFDTLYEYLVGKYDECNRPSYFNKRRIVNRKKRVLSLNETKIEPIKTSLGEPEDIEFEDNIEVDIFDNNTDFDDIDIDSDDEVDDIFDSVSDDLSDNISDDLFDDDWLDDLSYLDDISSDKVKTKANDNLDNAINDVKELNHLDSNGGINKNALMFEESVNAFISNETEIIKGQSSRKKHNLDAIKLVKDIFEKGKSITKLDQESISKFTGMSGLYKSFDDNSLSDLTPSEFKSLKATIDTAYYTPPKVITFMYGALRKIGFTGGRILDAGAGNGGFFTHMDKDIYDNSKLTAVEIDNLSSKMIKILHPDATVYNMPFEDLKLDDDYYDLFIGNVPFSSFKPYGREDKELNIYNYRIQEYFIAKAYKKVRPGGLIALITSAHTLDNQKSDFRRNFKDKMQLLAAFRMPSETFENVRIATDILFFKKEERDHTCALWGEVVNIDGTEYWINEYFKTNHHLMFGNLGTFKSPFSPAKIQSLFRDEKLNDDDFTKMLDFTPSNQYIPIEHEDDCNEELNCNVYDSYDEDDPFADLDNSSSTPDIIKIPRYENSHMYRSIDVCKIRQDEYVLIDGAIYQRKAYKLNRIDCTGMKDGVIRGYIGIRDLVIYISNNPDISDYDLKIKQSELLDKYNEFVRKYKHPQDPYLNRFLGDDQYGYHIFKNIENRVEKTNPDGTKCVIYEKASIFTKRLFGKSSKTATPSNISEARMSSLCKYGKTDFYYISDVLNISVDEVIKQLKENKLIYFDYETYSYMEDYLFTSGLVKDRLNAHITLLYNLEKAKGEDFVKIYNIDDEETEVHFNINDISEISSNIEVLKEHQPKTITDVTMKFYTTWIPTNVKLDFILKTLNIEPKGSRSKLTYTKTSGYDIRINEYIPHSLNYSEWGTSRFRAEVAISYALNQKVPKILDHEDKVDPEETQLAILATKKWADEFENYLSRNPEIRGDLVQLYNELFVRVKEPRFPDIVSHLRISGEKIPREHQIHAASRILLSDKNTLLYHSTGTGKTITMCLASHAKHMISMLERGVPHKSLFVIPNDLCKSGQFAADYLNLFSDAKILAFTPKDLEKNSRRDALSKIILDDWEAIIIPHSSFDMIPLKPETLEKFHMMDMAEIEKELAYCRETGDYATSSKIEKSMKNKEAQYKKKMDRIKERKDEYAIFFEDLGIDHIFLDEAHLYKNLSFNSKLGISTKGSQRASNLYNIIRYQNSISKTKNNVTLSTATPISNSMSELYTFMKYCDLNSLYKHDIDVFDSWASVFGLIKTETETDVTGKNFKVKSRFSEFVNIPELISIFKLSADIVHINDISEIKLPYLESGAPIIESINMYKPLDALVESFVERAKAVSNGIDPHIDNMLRISTHGREAAVSTKLLGVNSKSPKLLKVAENVYKHYLEDPNCAHLVFCDQGTPKSNVTYTAYQEIKDNLIDLGMNESDIAFIHDSGTSDAKRAQLIQKVDKGIIKVIIGSTRLMGVGTNFQSNLKSLHHVDPPWTPGEIEQREGRIVRQGNGNDSVYIYRYVIKGSFDAFSWQTLERKAKFIAQVVKNDGSIRTMQDLGEVYLDYTTAKAESCGNPLVKEFFEVQNEITKLEILRRKFFEQKSMEALTLKNLSKKISYYEEQLKILNSDAEIIDKHPKDVLVYENNGNVYTNEEFLLDLFKSAPTIGGYGKAYGLSIFFTAMQDGILIGSSELFKLKYARSPKNIYSKLISIPNEINTVISETEVKLNRCKEDLLSLQNSQDALFDKEERLSTLKSREKELEYIINTQKAETDKEVVELEDFTIYDDDSFDSKKEGLLDSSYLSDDELLTAVTI